MCSFLSQPPGVEWECAISKLWVKRSSWGEGGWAVAPALPTLSAGRGGAPRGKWVILLEEEEQEAEQRGPPQMPAVGELTTWRSWERCLLSTYCIHVL